jgi:hypothetical protein
VRETPALATKRTAVTVKASNAQKNTIVVNGSYDGLIFKGRSLKNYTSTNNRTTRGKW